MPLVLDRNQVLEVYAEASERGWVLPTFNSENLTTTESILKATLDYGDKVGVEDIPIIIGITNNYEPRPQSVLYTHTRRWDIGLKLFLKDLEVLSSKGSPYGRLKVMIHLDHIQWDNDLELLDWDMGQFSSIMYDASTLSLDKNIERTVQFREKHAENILIEGACDVIGKTSGDPDGGLTSPEDAYRFLSETGVDIIVANLGTEHRASAAELEYHSGLAKEITKKLGKGCLCLHGTSSVSVDSLGELFSDGIRKVNIWTALERDSSTVLFEDMINNTAKIIGQRKSEQLMAASLLGNNVDVKHKASIEYFTTTYRQGVIYESMQELVRTYLDVFYT